MRVKKISFQASRTPEAQTALEKLTNRYGSYPPDEADVIVALGGDGFMLESLHEHLDHQPPIFGMNRGSVGFLLNGYSEDALIERLENAVPVNLHPLELVAETMSGGQVAALAINEVALLRESRQAAKLRLYVDGKVRLEEVICDGMILSTTAGSTAYNASAYGPILPLGANVLSLTPISAFRPRRWRGAVLLNTSHVSIEVLEREKRPVSVSADFTEVRSVRRVMIQEKRDMSLTLLFDPEHNLEERILSEQFMH